MFKEATLAPAAVDVAPSNHLLAEVSGSRVLRAHFWATLNPKGFGVRFRCLSFFSGLGFTARAKVLNCDLGLIGFGT